LHKLSLFVTEKGKWNKKAAAFYTAAEGLERKF